MISTAMAAISNRPERRPRALFACDRRNACVDPRAADLGRHLIARPIASFSRDTRGGDLPIDIEGNGRYLM